MKALAELGIDWIQPLMRQTFRPNSASQRELTVEGKKRERSYYARAGVNVQIWNASGGASLDRRPYFRDPWALLLALYRTEVQLD